MSLLHKLTIILPTYNRHPYALRAMNYWSSRGVTLHVLDGSPKEINNKQLKKLGTNINYHHLPISILERLKQAIGFVNTDYTMLSGDDDIFLPSSIEKCICEIEFNNDIVSCMGRSLAFLPDQLEVKGWPVNEEMRGYSILQENPIERMICHMNPYTCSTVYSVLQTNVWKKAMAVLVEKDFQVPGIEELQFELVASYLGKSKVIENLMWLRSNENVPIRDYPSTAVRAHVWWEDKKMKKEHDEFLEIMSGILVDDEYNNLKIINNGIQHAVDAYTAQYDHKKSLIISLLIKIRSMIVRLLPQKVMDLLKTLLSLDHPESKEKLISLIEAAANLKNTGVYVNFDELKQIEKIITKFHVKEDKKRHTKIKQI